MRFPLVALLCASALPVLPAASASEATGATLASLALPACRAALGLPTNASAQELLQADPALPEKLAGLPACQSPAAALARLDQLAQELEASRQRVTQQQAELARETARQEALAQDLAQLRQQLTPSAPAPTPKSGPPRELVTFTPGKGVTLQAGGNQLRLWAEAKLLGFSSNRYVFNPGQPLVVSPKDPDKAYDLSAQQSTVQASFQGAKWGSWTPGAYALFTLQDNLLAEGYSFTPVAFYGQVSDGRWKVAAGQNFDVFAPRDPDTLPSGKLAATGNPGAYRPSFAWSGLLRGARGLEAWCRWPPRPRSPRPCRMRWMWPTSRWRRWWKTTAGRTLKRAWPWGLAHRWCERADAACGPSSLGCPAWWASCGCSTTFDPPTR
ncbi:MAG: hypothetical protein ACKO28_02595 [Cyanobium sp.]